MEENSFLESDSANHSDRRLLPADSVLVNREFVCPLINKSKDICTGMRSCLFLLRPFLLGVWYVSNDQSENGTSCHWYATFNVAFDVTLYDLLPAQKVKTYPKFQVETSIIMFFLYPQSLSSMQCKNVNLFKIWGLKFRLWMVLSLPQAMSD